jgi:hypothetical protein
MEKAGRKAILDFGVPILHKSVQIQAHADNAVIVQKYENEVKVAFNRLEMKAQKGVQWLVMTKQKYMENVIQTKEQCIRINNGDTENVNQFKYLGSNIA